MTTVDTGFDTLTRVGSSSATRWAIFEWGSTEPFCAVGVGLTGFGAINAEHGHRVGDGTLVQVARRIGAMLPPIPDGYLGRIGGDMFLALAALPDVREGTLLAARILDAVEQPLSIGTVTISPKARLVVVQVARRSPEPNRIPGLSRVWSIGRSDPRPDLVTEISTALDTMPRDGDPIRVLDARV